MSKPDPTPRIRVSALVVRDQRVLVVQHVKEDRMYYLLPGGGVDSGERLQRSLVRELNEELGVTATPGGLVLACDSISPAGDRHIVHLVFAATISGEPRATGTDARVHKAAWLSAPELAAAEFYPDIKGWVLDAMARPPAAATCLSPDWK